MIHREIKFRAWVNETMYKPFTLGEMPQLVMSALSHNIEVSLMQFTGLTDKNGKEIYDGDIVRILYTDWGGKSSDDPRTLEQYLIDIATIGIITWDYDRWAVKIDECYGSIKPGKHGYIEVIGNIYDTHQAIVHIDK